MLTQEPGESVKSAVSVMSSPKKQLSARLNMKMIIILVIILILLLGSLIFIIYRYNNSSKKSANTVAPQGNTENKLVTPIFIYKPKGQ